MPTTGTLTINLNSISNDYANHVLTEDKNKQKKKNPYVYIVAVLASALTCYDHGYVYAYACVANEDRA